MPSDDWVALPATDDYPKVRAHRRRPETPSLTFCGMWVRDGAQPTDRQCENCIRLWGDYRRRLRHPEVPAQLRPTPRGGSVRTVSGGLPGLGKR